MTAVPRRYGIAEYLLGDQVDARSPVVVEHATIDWLSQALGISYSSVRHHIQLLESDGVIVERGRGHRRWVIDPVRFAEMRRTSPPRAVLRLVDDHYIPPSILPTSTDSPTPAPTEAVALSAGPDQALAVLERLALAAINAADHHALDQVLGCITQHQPDPPFRIANQNATPIANSIATRNAKIAKPNATTDRESVHEFELKTLQFNSPNSRSRHSEVRETLATDTNGWGQPPDLGDAAANRYLQKFLASRPRNKAEAATPSWQRSLPAHEWTPTEITDFRSAYQQALNDKPATQIIKIVTGLWPPDLALAALASSATADIKKPVSYYLTQVILGYHRGFPLEHPPECADQQVWDTTRQWASPDIAAVASELTKRASQIHRQDFALRAAALCTRLPRHHISTAITQSGLRIDTDTVLDALDYAHRELGEHR